MLARIMTFVFGHGFSVTVIHDYLTHAAIRCFPTAGFVFYYTAIAYTMFWLFHVVILFWGIMFPFHAKTYENRGYFPYIHIMMLIAAIVLPLESVGVILGTGGLTISGFPPRTCFAREPDASYFAFVLPLSVMGAAGVSLIIIILWVVITRVGKLKSGQSEVSEGDKVASSV